MDTFVYVFLWSCCFQRETDLFCLPGLYVDAWTKICIYFCLFSAQPPGIAPLPNCPSPFLSVYALRLCRVKFLDTPGFPPGLLVHAICVSDCLQWVREGGAGEEALPRVWTRPWLVGWPWLPSPPGCLTRCFSFAPSTCSWPSQGLSSWWASSWCWASSWGATCASVCTWPPPTRPLTSGTKATGPGASSVPTWPGPQQRSRGPTGTSTPVGSGATFERSFCLLLCVTRERRNRDGKSVTAF